MFAGSVFYSVSGHVFFLCQLPGGKADKDKSWEIPALLRVKIWLGLEKHEMEWHKMQTEGELAVFAETVRLASNPLTADPDYTCYIYIYIYI